MTSRYILDAVERCKLPISVAHDGEQFVISTACYIWFPVSEWGAHSIYSHLVSKLQSVPASPPLAGCGVSSGASISPEGCAP